MTVWIEVELTKIRLACEGYCSLIHKTKALIDDLTVKGAMSQILAKF